MLATLARRLVVKGLDAVEERGRSSSRRPVRVAADALHRVRSVAGVAGNEPRNPIPRWTGQAAPHPMWDSDKRKVAKWRQRMGHEAPPEAEAVEAAQAARPVKLPAVHPQQSPFEALGEDFDPAVEEELSYEDLIQAVGGVLDECRPMVQADGGDIELLDVQGSVVHVQLTGNCIGCPSAQATLRQGIERRLKARIPQVTGIASPQLPAGA